MLQVLFVCEHNSARSQMAEAFLKHLGRDDFFVESCGLEAGTLNPLVIEVMDEIGYDLKNNTTQAALDLFKKGRSYDVVITVCSQKASELCPLFPGRALRLKLAFCRSFPVWRATGRPKLAGIRENTGPNKDAG
jgi:Protein-tyrosine-phosphatase